MASGDGFGAGGEPRTAPDPPLQTTVRFFNGADSAGDAAAALAKVILTAEDLGFEVEFAEPLHRTEAPARRR